MAIDVSDLSIKELESIVMQNSFNNDQNILKAMSLDKRKGVQKLLEKFFRCQADRKKMLLKQEMLLIEERKLWQQGYQKVAGIDEAGRGPLAGPVIAACVILPKDVVIEGIDDSKKLSPIRREELYDIIMVKALSIGIGRIEPHIIDTKNVLNASIYAMKQALLNMSAAPDYLLIDAVKWEDDTVPHLSMIKGDARSQSIAAASIIAKVTRDKEMMYWHKQFPEYGFDKHKGYGTTEHIRAIESKGLCPIHRRSFTSNFV
jgi:ribonuclease HII